MAKSEALVIALCRTQSFAYRQQVLFIFV